MSSIVNIKNDTCDKYIGRNSKWGNPFKIGTDGDRDKVIKLYEIYLLKNKDLILALPELKDKVLGCHCKPLKCHGDVLLKLLEAKEIMLGNEFDIFLSYKRAGGLFNASNFIKDFYEYGIYVPGNSSGINMEVY